MKNAFSFLFPVLLCFLVGFISGQLQQASIAEWYPTLLKPALTPPNIVFPIAWGILYICMGISAGFILTVESPRKKILLQLFVLQLFLNFLWSLLFFYLRNPLLGLADILLLDLVVVLYIRRSYHVSRTASLLLVPYLLWLLFATYLNAWILACN